jgi:hypothetical protein
MTLEMRKKLAREPFEEKIRKVGQLLRLVKTFPRRKKIQTTVIDRRHSECQQHSSRFT